MKKLLLLDKILFVCLCSGVFLCGCGVDETTPAASVRKSSWAQPVAGAGLPNLNRITSTLYRGAQPTDEGFKTLKKMGVRTVINLRQFGDDHDDAGRAFPGGHQFELVEIPIQTAVLDEEDIIAFLKVASDPAKQPVFFHCRHGADRTGTMAAAWRMVVEGWSADDAIEEMTRGGYGYHAVWGNLLDLLKKLDVKKIRAAVPNLPATATAAKE